VTDSSKFFSEPQGAAILKLAILKLAILKRYLPVFAVKTGSYSGQVEYLDCFAGPGSYDDDHDGSPALAIQTADIIAKFSGKAELRGHLIEKEPASVKALEELLQSQSVDWTVYQGMAADHVPAILDSIEPRAPLFAFIDPFGLPIPFDMVVDIMKRASASGSHVPTEVLMNFSTAGINRVGGQLTSTGTNATYLKARASMLNRMDEAMGGPWWREIWESEAEDRVHQIRDGYKERLRSAAEGNWGMFDIGVSDRWQGPTSYQLLLFTEHVDGVWHFHEALSSAQEEYRGYCHGHEGILDLEPLAERESQWVDHIEGNVEGLLVTIGSFRPVDKIVEVYGDSFGEAREKHLRKALKRLHAAGKLSTDPKGQKLGTLTLKP
jgi:three-Cys-motif partner protein